MRKNIWIFNHYAGDMFFSKGGRHYWFADCLKQKEYNPIVFCSNTKHDVMEFYLKTDQLYKEVQAEEIDVPFIFVRSSLYTGNGKARYKNMFTFYENLKRVAKEYAKIHGVPDVILASSVHPLTMVAGIQLAKAFKIKCVCEVRDLWPEEIVAYSDKWTNNDFLIKVLYQGEKWIYKHADDVIFLQEGAYDYIKEHRWDKAIPRNKVHYINNGVDLDAFDKNKENYVLADFDLDDNSTFKFIYTGSIRRANNIGSLLEVAKQLQNTKVKFLIWGDGDELQALTKRCIDENITNVVLKGRVEKKFIPSIISRANVNLLHWSMSEDLKYGPSFNKMFEYLAAGKPILTTLQTPYSIILNNKCGYATKDDSVDSIVKMVEMMANLPPNELSTMGANARLAASKYDFRVLTDELIKIIEK